MLDSQLQKCGLCLVSASESIERRSELYLGDMTPFEFMTRCQGTFPEWKGMDASEGRCLRQTPTCRGLCAKTIRQKPFQSYASRIRRGTGEMGPLDAS